MSITKIIWRWLYGAPLNGRWKTDASWLRAGTKASTRPGPAPTRWSYLPLWKRSALRQLALVVAPAGVWAWLVHPRLFMAAAACVVVLMAVAGWLWGRSFRHQRDVVRPLHDALKAQVRDLPSDRGYLSVPVKLTEDTPATIALPTTFATTAENMAGVAELVRAKLGYHEADVDVTWRTKGVPLLLVKLAPQPPDLVRFGDLAGEMAACRPGEVIFGLDKRQQVYRGSFLTDDPHWGASVGSRRGKSTFLTVTAAQLLRQDVRAQVVGIDVKRVSFAPLVGVPGFRLRNDPADIGGMWAEIAQVRAEMDARSAILEADPTATFGFLVLMIDEINQFANQSAAYWSQVKPKDAPKRPPVWDDIAAILWQGAQMLCHVIALGQRFDTAATGGFGLRDSFGLKGLAGFRPNQWKFLVGTTPVPRSSRKRGRWIWSDGEDETWVQMAYGAGDELAAYASVGRGGDGAGGLSQVAASGLVTAPAATVPATRWVIGNEAGAAELGISVDAFRQRRQRAAQRGESIPGEIRQGNRPAWPADALRVWAGQESNA